jgi:hypothetical protein
MKFQGLEFWGYRIACDCQTFGASLFVSLLAYFLQMTYETDIAAQRAVRQGQTVQGPLSPTHVLA